MTGTLDAGPAPVGPGAGPTPTPTGPTVGGVPQSELSANIQEAVQAAPEVAQNPGTAVAVASTGGNVTKKAQAVAQAGNRQAVLVAQHEVQKATGLWGDITHGIGDVVQKVQHYANDGLSTVQQEYRYLHDVEARHGRMAALTEGVGILGGAVVGTILEPGEGTVLGAEAAARLEGAIQYQDSWRRAANPNYRDPHTGQLVSFGRDVASALHLRGGERTVFSGALDGLADLTADPVANAGKLLGAAHDINGMDGVLGKVYRGTAITPENVDHAYQTLPSVRRAFQDIAASSPGDIVRKYPQFASIADTLGLDAHTADDVRQVFKELADSSNMVDAKQLPTISLTRQAFRPLRDMARNAGEGPISNIPYVGALGRRLANNSVIGVRRWADRLEALPGATFDPEHMDFSGSQINPADMRGATDIYRMMRYAASDRESRAVVDAYAAATPAQRIVIAKNAIFKTLFAMAHVAVPDDDEDMEDYLSELVDGRTKNALLERLNNHLGAANIEGSAPERVYGTMASGRVVPGVVDREGAEIQGAILENQTGNLSIPNIVEARRMAQAIRSSRVSRVLAGTDDFLYDHVTQGFFKPLVLMSGGYGLHISLAEAIPNTLRHGLVATARGLYDRAIANLGYKADEDELRGLSGWLYDMAGSKALENSRDAQYLTEMYVANEGYKTSPGVAAGEITQGETQPVEKAIQGFRQKMAMSTREGSDFSTFGNEDKRFPRLWQSELRENARSPWAREAAQAYLDAAQRGLDESHATEEARQVVANLLRDEPQNVKDTFVREQLTPRGAPASWTPEDGHAQAIVDKVKGSVHGRNPDVNSLEAGPLHVDLLRDVANGRTPELGELEGYDPSARPLQIKGRTVVPDGSGLVQRIANFGFRKILNPMVNILSRNQEYAVEYVEARRVLQPAVDKGLMTDEQALVRAQSQASTHVMRFVHNLHDRTQWTATMRNWAPFYFAQEQAYRRMGRLLAEDPGAFRRYQMMITGVSHLTAEMQGANGNQYIAFPGSGFLGKGVADLMGMHGMTIGPIPPAAFGGSLSSANVIFPLSQGFKPDLGPVAILPLAQLGTFLPELGKKYPDWAPVTSEAASALDYVTGQSPGYQEPIWEQLIPNSFVQRIVQATWASDGDRSFNSSVMQAYQYFDYMQSEATDKWEKDGRKGPAPQIVPGQGASAMVKQQFADKVRNYVRALYIARAITGMASPVSSEVEIQDFGFPQKLQDAITKAGSVSGGMSKFLLENPNAVPYTVAQSYVPSDTDASQSAGMSLPSTQQAEDWIAANQGLLQKYGTAALWLVPQLHDDKYSPTVYNEQLAQGLRQKDTPQQFLQALYVAAGDNLYYSGLTIHENALQAAGTDKSALNAEYNSWDTWVAQLEKAYPVWAEFHTSGVRQTNSQQTIQKLTQMFQAGDAPAGTQTDGVKWLLQNYDLAANDYANAGNQSSYSAQLSAQSKINDSWVQFLDTAAANYPFLKPVIDTVFKQALKVQT